MTLNVARGGTALVDRTMTAGHLSADFQELQLRVQPPLVAVAQPTTLQLTQWKAPPESVSSISEAAATIERTGGAAAAVAETEFKSGSSLRFLATRQTGCPAAAELRAQLATALNRAEIQEEKLRRWTAMINAPHLAELLADSSNKISVQLSRSCDSGTSIFQLACEEPALATGIENCSYLSSGCSEVFPKVSDDWS